MSGSCGTINPGAWVQSLIGATGCQADLLGSGGWQGLSGSTLFNVVLTGALTLAVARLGYRLMSGSVIPADIVVLLLHIGVVIALATSWMAYDRLIYRVAMEGPAEIAGELFPAAGIDAAKLSVRLQNAYDTIAPPRTNDMAAAGTAADPAGAAGSTANVAEAAPAPESLAMAERRSAADVMVITGAGSWMAARLALALLLALGPLAFAASLFPASAGLFIGWLRAIVGTALAGLAIPIAISFELQMLEGPVRAALRSGATEITGLNAIVWSFALVIVGLLLAVQRIAGGLSMPLPVARPQHVRDESLATVDGAPPATHSVASHSRSRERSASMALSGPSRTEGIVHAMAARERSTVIPAPRHAAPALVHQAAPARGARIIRRGSQIVDGARRTATDRGLYLSQRPEAQA